MLGGDLVHVARAITLVESARPDHREQAAALLERLLPASGRSQRVGLTGVPGAGKSTLIDALGTHLTAAGHRVAVLAVDPSSTRRGGSILGDKTRMPRLAVDPAAFIRPSPTSGSLGGVTRATREAIVVVEAAGYDVVVVETVGVGQSETVVADMVDCFVVLLVARTGDGLQGIKKGILELAEIVAVNKADDGHEREAAASAAELADALHLLEPVTPGWTPPVLTLSARNDTGVRELWDAVLAHRRALETDGRRDRRRAGQQVRWMWSMVTDRVLADVRSHPAVADAVPDLEAGLRDGRITAAAAAATVLAAAARPR